jgi:phosphoenolpyruvate carboxykinase (GTP)
MEEKHAGILEKRLKPGELAKLHKIDNEKLLRFVADSVDLCEPEEVFICTDADEDIDRIRKLALEQGEELALETEGHTIHFDGYHDQARDKERTAYLVPKGSHLGDRLRTVEKEKGVAEIRNILRGIMRNKLMIVRFLCLGPTDSDFSVVCVQITDSAYVAHSESVLYRPGYEQFRKMGSSSEIFRFLHSAGELGSEHNVSRNIDERRVYIDLEDEIVYSTNTQYAGNTIGLKKPALRLAIRKADREGWLAEHMFLMGVHGPEERVTYFSGAFPSGCGKTCTSMVAGHTVVGDDLAYLRAIDGEARAVNVESGIFGIIENVNERDDPVIWDALHQPGEVIFTNQLMANGRTYWLGMDIPTPDTGINHSGEWYEGKIDADGKEIPLANKNARYTIRLEDLANVDPALHDPEGVALGGVIYGGRDSDAWVPVCESFDWAHGILTMGASLESKTTAATLGKSGERKFNLMSILDFLSIPLGRYIQNNLSLADELERTPKIFGVNYFLEDERGGFLNAKLDKAVWLRWMEHRVHGEVGAIETPVGLIPTFEDLEKLFPEVLGKTYAQGDYEKQFAIRVEHLLEKLDRVEAIYRNDVPDVPDLLFRVFGEQRERLRQASEKHRLHTIPPSAFPRVD